MQSDSQVGQNLSNCTSSLSLIPNIQLHTVPFHVSNGDGTARVTYSFHCIQQTQTFPNVIAYSLVSSPTPHHSLPVTCLKCLKCWSQLLRPAIHTFNLVPSGIKFGMALVIWVHKMLKFSHLKFTQMERKEPTSSSSLVQ